MTRETITIDKALFDEALANLLSPKSGQGENGYAVGILKAMRLLVVGAPAKEFAEPYVPPTDHAV